MFSSILKGTIDGSQELGKKPRTPLEVGQNGKANMVLWEIIFSSSTVPFFVCIMLYYNLLSSHIDKGSHPRIQPVCSVWWNLSCKWQHRSVQLICRVTTWMNKRNVGGDFQINVAGRERGIIPLGPHGLFEEALPWKGDLPRLGILVLLRTAVGKVAHHF